MTKIRWLIWDDKEGTWGEHDKNYPSFWPRIDVYKGETHNRRLNKLYDYPSLTPWNIKDKKVWKHLPFFGLLYMECPSPHMQAIMYKSLEFRDRWKEELETKETQPLKSLLIEDLANFYDDNREEIETYVSKNLAAQIGFFGLSLEYWGTKKAYIFNPSCTYFQNPIPEINGGYMPGKWTLMVMFSMIMNIADEMERTHTRPTPNAPLDEDYWRSVYSDDNDSRYGYVPLPFSYDKTTPNSKMIAPKIWNLRDISKIKTLLSKEDRFFELLIAYMKMTEPKSNVGEWFMGVSQIMKGDGSLTKVVHLRKILNYEYSNDDGKKMRLFNPKLVDPDEQFFLPWLRPFQAISWLMYYLNNMKADYLEIAAQNILDGGKVKERLPMVEIAPPRETKPWSEITPPKTARDKVIEDDKGKKEYDDERDQLAKFKLPPPLPIDPNIIRERKLIPLFTELREYWKDTAMWSFKGKLNVMWPLPKSEIQRILRIDPSEEYEEYYLRLIDFISENPILRLKVPPFDWNEFERRSEKWQIAADRQFEVYLKWCIQNSETDNKSSDYKQPGEIYSRDDLKRLDIKSSREIPNGYPHYGILDLDQTSYTEEIGKMILRIVSAPALILDWLFGDDFWNRFFHTAQQLFNFLIEILVKIVKKAVEIITDNWEVLLPIALVIVGGWVGSVIVKEKIKENV